MTILLFVVILVVLIVGHEFGHFIVAKLSGMQVPEFGLGFPPKLWGKKIGETEYTVNALPLGGFVKIHGEDIPDEHTPGDANAFYNKPKILQASTLVAGPFMNLVLAFFFSAVAFMIGVPAAMNAGYDNAYIHGAEMTVVEVLPNSPAAKAGVEPGDVILSAEDGHYRLSELDPAGLSAFITRAGTNATVALSVRVSDGSERTFFIHPAAGLVPAAPSQPAVGIATASVGTLNLPFFQAIAAGFQETVRSTWAVLTGLIALIGHVFTLSANLSSVAGPVGIASLVGDAARFGLGSVLSFAALISVNLGIINLFPFPALDGGRLALLGVEAASRRRVPAKVANAVNAVGFAALILLLIVVTAHDVLRLIS